MDENCFLIGTAGHVDHGKTQLIQALTGISTDRLKEEKERGISIELGFAYLTLPNGKKAGIVDVPGHERFIRQMLAGASGIDVVLLVIAADEGVMPQTQEHLDILQLLEIKKGIIVITKVDLVEEDWLMMVEEDVKEKLKGSFLEKAPLCKVSAITKEGIPELLEMITQTLLKTEQRRIDLPARMPIDRVFTVQGFGTVVTGTLTSGVLKKGQDIAIEPGGFKTKIRNIQIHGEQTAQVLAGQRAAINLSSLAVSDIERGMNVVALDSFIMGNIVDVELINLKSEQRKLQQRQRVHFYSGTSENIGRIHLIEREELLPGETAFAQIILEKPIIASHGDRFVIRYYSPLTTIGGGRVLGIAPAKRKRFRDREIDELLVKAQGNKVDQLRKFLREPSTLIDLKKNTELTIEDIEEGLEDLKSNNELLVLHQENNYLYWQISVAESWGRLASDAVAQYQRKNPLKAGIGREELKSQTKLKVNSQFWSLILKWGAEQSYFKITGNLVEAFPEVELPEKLKEIRDNLLEVWEKSELNLPDLKDVTLQNRIDRDKFEEFAAYLITKGQWIRIGEYPYAVSSVEKAKSKLIAHLKQNKEITVSEARDLFQTTRKHALPVLEYFDEIRLTKRDDNVRKLY